MMLVYGRINASLGLNELNWHISSDEICHLQSFYWTAHAFRTPLIAYTTVYWNRFISCDGRNSLYIHSLIYFDVHLALPLVYRFMIISREVVTSAFYVHGIETN